MSSVFDTERIHETYKSIIKDEWNLGEEGINKYEYYRQQIEENARVKDYIPILTFRKVKEEFNNW